LENSDRQVRIVALDLALKSNNGKPLYEVLEAAKKYYEFIINKDKSKSKEIK